MLIRGEDLGDVVAQRDVARHERSDEQADLEPAREIAVH
jgi:hypothetical protein